MTLDGRANPSDPAEEPSPASASVSAPSATTSTTEPGPATPAAPAAGESSAVIMLEYDLDTWPASQKKEGEALLLAATKIFKEFKEGSKDAMMAALHLGREKGEGLTNGQFEAVIDLAEIRAYEETQVEKKRAAEEGLQPS